MDGAVVAQLPSPGAQGLGLDWSSHKTTGTALRVPHAHPSLALECHHPARPQWDPPSHRCAHLAACPVPAGGQTFKFSLPKSYHNSAVCPCTGNTILMNFPANFPASPSPASVCVCNYCAQQLLPSATALCPVYYSSSPASQGLGEWQLCQAESPSMAAAAVHSCVATG